MRGGNLGWLIGACLLLGSAVGRTEAASTAFQLVYTASDGCPSEADFIALVVARTHHARLARPGEDRRTFVVSLRAEGRRTRGSLALQGPGGTTETREIVAESCEQAARAVSLIVALALDPSSPDPSYENPAPKPAPSGRQRGRLQKPPSSGRSAHDDMATKSVPAAVVSTGLSAELRGGVAPAPVLVVPSLFASVRLDPRWTAAIVTVGMGRRVASLGLGEARFTYLAGRAELCAWLVQSPVRAGPCAGFSAGVVSARGASGDHPGTLAVKEHRIEPWLEPTGMARLSWAPVAWIELNAVAGLGAPLYHSLYYFGRGSGEPFVVHQVPNVAGFAGLGAGLVFR